MTRITGAGGGGGKGGGGGGASTPGEARDNLANNAYVRIIDVLGEGELQGFSTPEKAATSKSSAAYNVELLKDIFINNSPVLRSSAAIKTGTYSQTDTTITVTCAGHGFAVANKVVLTPSSGLAAGGTYVIKTVTTDSFTADSQNKNVTSGDLAITLASDYNFTGLSLFARYGTANQSFVPGFDNVENEVAVASNVEQEVPITRTLTNPDIDIVRVTISVPQLQYIKSDGNIVGTSLNFQIQLSENGGTFYTVIDEKITGRTVDQLQRDYEVSLVGKQFPIDVRLVRITADSTSARLANAFSWSSYTEITSGRFTYPNTAYVASRISAEQFNSIPSRAYRVRGRKIAIPSNATVDRATGALIYSGMWDGSFAAAQWCADPAWCLWDMLTNYRFGLGDQLNSNQLDRWAFYSASQYCSALNTRPSGTTDDYHPTTGRHGVPDGRNGYEPRFSCNTNLQTQEEAYKLINDLCSVFRVMPYWATGALTISQDSPVDPAYLFTTANISEDGFAYSASSQKTKPSVVLVGYLDLDRRDVAYEQVEDQAAIKRFGVVTQEITAFGCTSRSQARRVGEWILYANNYEAEVVSFTASLDAGIVVRPGQVINIADPLKSGARRGGRIKAATTTAITVDSTVDLPASGGTLSVILPDNTVETRSVSSRSGAVITVSPAFSRTPNVNSIWVYENSAIETTTWRVLSVTEQDQCNYVVNAVSYNASKYDYIERDQELVIRDVTDLNVRPDPPDAIALTESLYSYQAQIRAKVTIHWQAVDDAASYRVRWRVDENNWQEDTAFAPSYEILDITPGTFEVEVYSVNSSGLLSSTSASNTLVALGKTAPPADVANFFYTVDEALGVTFSWDPVTDIDLETYEIRRGTSWASATLVTQVNATTYQLGSLLDGNYTYLIKALDTSGIYSATATPVTVVISPPGTPSVSSTFEANQVVLKWTEPTVTTHAIDYYIIRAGGVFSSATEVAQVYSNTITVPVTWFGARTFWVAAVDVAGRISATPGSEVVTIVGPGAPDITRTVTGTDAFLSWQPTAATGTSSDPLVAALDIFEYEIRKGETYETATVITKLSSLAYSFKADWQGSQTFWVVAIDINGNYGTPSSVAVSVNTSLAPTIESTVFSGENLVIKWTAVKGDLDTEFYRLKRGSTWASASLVANIKGTTYTLKVDWGGTQRLWLAAVDVNGAEGAAASADIVVTAPAAPSITQQVVDNNVLMRWNDVTRTLPIVSYLLKRGPSWTDPSTVTIGTKQGGFTSVFETQSGTYTYWLAGIDSAGNEGTPGAVSAIVAQPPDYVLQRDKQSLFDGTEVNIYTDPLLGQIVGVNTTETWQSHFTSRGWTTPQNQINAGFPYYLQPSQTSASYVEELDHGAVLIGSKVSLALTSQNIAGSTTITPTISLRGTTGDWVVYPGVSEVFGSNFRYVRARYDFASAGGDDLLVLSKLNIRLDAKLRNDAGKGTANAGDVGGTTVTFGYAFVDVESISVTALSTAPRIAVYDFVDAPNPTSFKVLLYDTAGNRVSGAFSWSARGY